MADVPLNPAAGALPDPSADRRLRFGPFALDIARRELRRSGQVVPLRPKGFDLLAFLASRPLEVLAKDQLIAVIWPGIVVTDDSLTQCVHELRTALGDSGATLLRTVPRHGYRFDADVQPDRPAAAPTVPPLSLVLLPLELEDDAETGAWFADVLTADLTAELGRIPSVFMISRGTAFTYKGKAADPRDVSRELGVRYVVRGSVRGSGEQVRLAMAMDDGESGAQLWAQSFDIERSRLGASLDDIVQQVARGLNVQMYRSGGTRAAALSPRQVQADDLAMQGWGAYFHGVSRENLQAALSLFEQAVAKDPDSILGWGGVAAINGIGASIGWLPDHDAVAGRVEFASARLDELDSEHLFALVAKEHVTNLREDYEACAMVAKMAIERYHHAPSYSMVAIASMYLGRLDECVELMQRAIQLSPRDPLLGCWHQEIGMCRFLRGEYPEAAAMARLAGQLRPGLPQPPLLLAAALARDGQTDEGRRIVAAYLQRHPDFRAANVAKFMPSKHPMCADGRARLIDSLRELGMR
jgi:DNA-binding winged helix-turn-helix (wHTH) protein/tetratricopeptide (TPR) repeat protein